MKKIESGYFRRPQLEKNFSLKSIESILEPRMEANESNIFEMMATDCRLDKSVESSREYPEMICDSPYFDRTKRTMSRFHSFERSE